MARYAKQDLILGGLTPIPYDRYSVVIKSAEVKTAQGVNKHGEPKKPTLRVRCEILEPEQVTINGQRVNVAGRPFMLMPNSIDPTEDWGLGRIAAALEKSNFDFTLFNPEGEIDDEKFSVLAGHKMDMLLDCEEDLAQRDPTPDEVAAGKSGRQNILDANGKPISRGWNIKATWDNVVGPYSGDKPSFQ